MAWGVQGNIRGPQGSQGNQGNQGYQGVQGATGATGIPAGLIAIWSGPSLTIPEGWVLCDGNNGTPDLRDKFVIGAQALNVGFQGGATTHQHANALTTEGGAHTHASDGGHQHDTAAAHQHSIPQSDSQGGHQHDSVAAHQHTGGAHQHQMADHSHGVGTLTMGNSPGSNGLQALISGTNLSRAQAAHQHTMSGSVANGGATASTYSGGAVASGGGGAHQHAAGGAHQHAAATSGSGGAHQHAVGGAHAHNSISGHQHSLIAGAQTNMPPYYALCFIMKT